MRTHSFTNRIACPFRHPKATLMSLMLAASGASGQTFRQTDQGISARIGNTDLTMQFYTPGILRVTKAPHGTNPQPRSYSVVQTPRKVAFAVKATPSGVQLSSDSLKVSVQLETGRILYEDSRGRLLLAEKDYGCQFTPVEYAGQPTLLVRQAFRLDADECIYGLGQQQTGKMNQRNQHIYLKQENTKICIPFFQSVKGYGLLWDNNSPTTFTDNENETAFDSHMGTCADYYFMYGGNAENVVRCIRHLTGNAPMNALWTYGFWQSRERYRSQEEVVDVVKKYRSLQIPLDCIVQDWQYWGTDYNDWNSTEFGNPAYNEPKKMIDEVHRLNAHIAISVWPSFGKKTAINKLFKEKHMLLDFTTWPSQAEVYDPFHPAARDIYWEHLNKNMFALGMDAWWLDATEPEFADKETRMDQPTHDGLYRGCYNAFPLVSTGGIYDHQRATPSEKRVTILTRSAFTGQQRYATTCWSGDVQSTWETLRKQIPAGLNFSACGLPYWNTDIGGFVSATAYPQGNKDLAYRELYVRWNQFGTFTPMMRSHGTNTAREIYNFGERGTWAFDAIEKYIRLRYKFMPYIYATAWNVCNEGGSFMRGLFMDFVHDAQVYDIDDQYMFGKALLVAPVTTSMYINSERKADFSRTGSRKVYLPAGTDWYDFWTGERLTGKQTVDRACPIDIIPLYVRAGSILPVGPDVQYAAEKPWDRLEIKVYPGSDGAFRLYEDEKDNYNYEKGVFSTIDFAWDDAKRTLTIGKRAGQFPGMLEKRRFDIVIVEKGKGGFAQAAKPVKSVTYSGKQTVVKF